MVQKLSHAKLKFFRRVRLEKKIRDQELLFFAEGNRVVQELYIASPTSLIALVIRESKSSSSFQTGTAISEVTYIATEKQFQELSDTENSQGVVGIFMKPKIHTSDSFFHLIRNKTHSKILILQDVQDPGNVGTIIRTAAWFNFDGVILYGATAELFNPKVVRASAGCLFSIQFYPCRQLIEDILSLKSIGFKIYGATLDGTDFKTINFTSHSALIIGNEANGIHESVFSSLDEKLKIEGNDKHVESLNASVSAGILMSFISQNN